jgi:hypothetical protein
MDESKVRQFVVQVLHGLEDDSDGNQTSCNIAGNQNKVTMTMKMILSWWLVEIINLIITFIVYPK